MKILTLILLITGVVLLVFPDVCFTKGEGYTPPPDPDMPTHCTYTGGIYWWLGFILIALGVLIGREPIESGG